MSFQEVIDARLPAGVCEALELAGVCVRAAISKVMSRSVSVSSEAIGVIVIS
jgi:hypothetical protein